MALSDGAKERLSLVIELVKTVFHYGYIPAVVYLGFKQGAEPGMPEIALSKLLPAGQVWLATRSVLTKHFPVRMQSLRVVFRLLGAQPLAGAQCRAVKRWVSPTMRVIVLRKKALGPQPEQRRSQFLEWNEEVELRCFSKRLGEEFEGKALREAFVQPEWANVQEFQARQAGDTAFEPIAHNRELAENGAQIISQTIRGAYAPSYPSDVVEGIHSHLTSQEMLAHVGKHLGIKDLIKSLEYPPEERSLADTFRALVGALALSSPAGRVQRFVDDFLLCQMVGKDVYDIWAPAQPYEYMLRLLQAKGVEQVEPRLCNQSASNTILANFQVGLYDAKSKTCLGLGWGENIKTAKETAALDAIQRLHASD
ncbi:hypothetical protein D910_05895 [Dendroctonus ponderosae]|uniref:Large ribosomal subunit protein mL44 n=2 Tax=Dendroctonus ponderosae TaxID=77166 RepID=U4U3P4_DENPD|nr:hypothetical protein D910_05895 [Dendroctonus ponderosae]